MLRQAISSTLSLFTALPLGLALVAISAVSAVIMLLVFKAVTPSHWMTKPRDRMTAAIYEMRLYLDHPRRVISAQLDLIRYSLTYSAAMLPAVVILTIPFGLVVFDLEARWGYEPLNIAEPVTVRVDLSDGVKTFEAKPADCAELNPAVLHFPSENVAYARYTLKDAADCVVSFTVDGQDVTKQLDAAAGPVSPARLRGFDLLTTVTFEDALDHDGVQMISVHHEPAQFEFLGTDWPWWAHWLWMIFFLSGLLLKPLRITL